MNQEILENKNFIDNDKLIDIVKKHSFNKFVAQSHILDELIVHTIHTNCVDELVAWVFDEIRGE